MRIEEIFEQYYKIKFKPYESVSEGVKCCKRKSLINNRGEVVCIFCGQGSHYEMVNEGFIDFYEHLYRIWRKSKYQRKYHMDKVLQTKLAQNHIDLTSSEMYEFIRIFKRIELLFFELYPSRKKLIKFDFLFYKILQFMNLDASKIFSKRLSKQTAKKYDEIWNNIKAHL